MRRGDPVRKAGVLAAEPRCFLGDVRIRRCYRIGSLRGLVIMRTFAPSLMPTQVTRTAGAAGFGRPAVMQAARRAQTGNTTQTIDDRITDPEGAESDRAEHRFGQLSIFPRNHSTGGRMPADVQEKMERHFGYDFSAVRIHQDSDAARMGARAYAQGPNLHFAPGAYAPRTLPGQQLLGHELAHVVQQAQGRVSVPSQAKGESINDDPALEREADRMGADATRASEEDQNDQPKEDFAARLRRLETGGGVSKQPIQRKVKVPAKTKLPGLHKFLTRNGDVYSYPRPIRRKGDLSLEIITSLFNSARTFKLKGSTSKKVESNLFAHLRARKGVIEFAKLKKYAFTGGRANFKMNSKYWWVDKSTGKYGYKKGVDRQKAREDLNISPTEYTIGCAAATKLTVKGGANASRFERKTTDDHDWVPGEDGYIENTGWNGTDEGIEGENIIYMGAKKFWGHFPNEAAIKTYKEWFNIVKGWNGSAKLTKDRNYPSTGMK